MLVTFPAFSLFFLLGEESNIPVNMIFFFFFHSLPRLSPFVFFLIVLSFDVSENKAGEQVRLTLLIHHSIRNDHFLCFCICVYVGRK